MDGVLVVDKPVGPSSHDAVARVRRALGQRRIGHTGTLDPAASGVLPLVLGRATRLARVLSAGDKRYEATVRFGFATDTYDASGRRVGDVEAGAPPGRDAVERVLPEFEGTRLQRPPAFSAKKIGGKRSYDIARRRARNAESSGDAAHSVEESPAPVLVTAHAIRLVEVSADRATLDIVCSAGFYVRTLAHDLGRRLGQGAHLAVLRRIESAGLTAADAVALEEVERTPTAASRALIPLARLLPAFTAVQVTALGAERVAHGRDVGPHDLTGDVPDDALYVRLFDPEGQLLAIAEPSGASGFLHPSVVLV
jgi:tRNA pseudouridine55 synthase